MTVLQYFNDLASRLNLTNKQIESVNASRDRILTALQSSRKISLIYQKPCFYTGSYSRNTIIRPLDDIDLYIRINYSKHAEGKSPREIIVLFMQALKKTLPMTPMKVSPPCIEVKFSDKRFEVVPVVSYENNDDLYDIPSADLKSWKQCYPNLPNKWLTQANKRNGGLFIPLIKMIKQWIRNNNLRTRIKSFHVELLTDRVFSKYNIESYPKGIYSWFYVVNELFRHNSEPFIIEPEGYKYVDEYLFKKLPLLRIFKNKIDKGLRLSDKAINYWLKGKDKIAICIFKNLFGSLSK
jgi:hypothetical protein